MIEMPFEGTSNDIEFIRDGIWFGGSVLEQVEQDIPGGFPPKDGDRPPLPRIVFRCIIVRPSVEVFFDDLPLVPEFLKVVLDLSGARSSARVTALKCSPGCVAIYS